MRLGYWDNGAHGLYDACSWDGARVMCGFSSPAGAVAWLECHGFWVIQKPPRQGLKPAMHENGTTIWADSSDME